MKIRDKNPERVGLIQTLYKKGIEKDTPLWKAVARGLNRPRKKGHNVNLYQIEKISKKNELIIVPGNVLGTGEVTKPVTVAADRFSKSAQEKIRKAGGKTLSLGEVSESYSKGRVRIMG
jgi:large subunit ribosomal protein L18e